MRLLGALENMSRCCLQVGLCGGEVLIGRGNDSTRQCLLHPTFCLTTPLPLPPQQAIVTSLSSRRRIPHVFKYLQVVVALCWRMSTPLQSVSQEWLTHWSPSSHTSRDLSAPCQLTPLPPGAILPHYIHSCTSQIHSHPHLPCSLPHFAS